MSKYEKKGTITFSPTAITDKEEVHDLYKRTESGCECNSNSGPTFMPILASANGENTYDVKANVIYDDIMNMIEQHLPLVAFLHDYNSRRVYVSNNVDIERKDYILFYMNNAEYALEFYSDGRIYFNNIGG